MERVLLYLRKKGFIKEWIRGKYHEKPIIIYGNPGTGKTTLANYILKDHTIIHINIEFCRNKLSLEDYLKMSLYKKSITMMFSKDNHYKALLFDDLSYIQLNDKALFKSIIDFSKKKVKDHPIIYIFNSIKHKSIQKIYNQSFPLNISYTKEQYIELIKDFFLEEKDTEYDYFKLIEKSHHNFHNIKVNLGFYKKNMKMIYEYDKKNNEIDMFIKDLFLKDIKSIYYSSHCDYTIIGLNILENCIQWVFKSDLTLREKVQVIDLIYYNNYLGDILLTKIHNILDWELIEHLITNTIVIPILLIRNNDIKVLDMDYNKYISKCIIYTHNRKLLISNEINYEILTVLYNYVKKFTECDLNKKSKVKDEIIMYINGYNIPVRIIEKFSKFFLSDKKVDYKIFYE